MKLAPQEMRTYSLTFVTAQRRTVFQVTRHAELFLQTLRSYRDKGNFELHAFVVMPDHVHLLLTPAPLVSLEKAVQLIKGGFSFRLKSKLGVWDRGFFDRRVQDAEAFDTCKRYIEQNPVRAKLVAEATEYSFSSARMTEAVDGMPQWFWHAGQG